MALVALGAHQFARASQAKALRSGFVGLHLVLALLRFSRHGRSPLLSFFYLFLPRRLARARITADDPAARGDVCY